LGAVAVYEFFSCVGLKKEVWLLAFTLLLSVVYVVTQHINLIEFFAELYNDLWFVWGRAKQYAPVLLLLVFMVASIARHKQLPVDRLVMLMGLCVYAWYGFQALADLSQVDIYHSSGMWERTRVYLWIALCIPWVADSLAYFSGYFFGKRKLCPEISPKKTVEGAIGGVASTGIVAVLAYGFAKSWDIVPLLVVFFGAMILAVVSIYGDLFASVVKRHFGVKDYGKLFPGHGGVMDRFDSTIPVAITLQLLLNIPYFTELL
jgi:phosphatidate cytidylyltransferase